jgi:hypothetical protein
MKPEFTAVKKIDQWRHIPDRKGIHEGELAAKSDLDQAKFFVKMMKAVRFGINATAGVPAVFKGAERLTDPIIEIGLCVDVSIVLLRRR